MLNFDGNQLVWCYFIVCLIDSRCAPCIFFTVEEYYGVFSTRCGYSGYRVGRSEMRDRQSVFIAQQRDDYFTIRYSVESRLRQLRQSLQKNCCLFRAMIIVLRLFSLLLSYWNAMLLSLFIAGWWLHWDHDSIYVTIPVRGHLSSKQRVPGMQRNFARNQKIPFLSDDLVGDDIVCHAYYHDIRAAEGECGDIDDITIISFNIIIIYVNILIWSCLITSRFK